MLKPQKEKAPEAPGKDVGGGGEDTGVKQVDRASSKNNYVPFNVTGLREESKQNSWKRQVRIHHSCRGRTAQHCISLRTPCLGGVRDRAAATRNLRPPLYTRYTIIKISLSRSKEVTGGGMCSVFRRNYRKSH